MDLNQLRQLLDLVKEIVGLPPRHVHVYRDGELVVKWDLDNKRAMKGRASRRILRLIADLESEELL